MSKLAGSASHVPLENFLQSWQPKPKGITLVIHFASGNIVKLVESLHKYNMAYVVKIYRMLLTGKVFPKNDAYHVNKQLH